jgi:hypothetical protein
MFKVLRDKLKVWKKQTATELEDVITEDSGRKIKESKLENFLFDLEIVLMEADVALPVIVEIKSKIEEDLIGKRVTKKVSFSEGIEIALRNALKDVMLVEPLDFVQFIKDRIGHVQSWRHRAAGKAFIELGNKGHQTSVGVRPGGSIVRRGRTCQGQKEGRGSHRHGRKDADEREPHG